MDLHYCDLCGTIIQGHDLESCRVTDSTVCSTCRENAGANTATARPRADDEMMSSVLQESNLDLFSSDTIARRKGSTDARTESRLTLVDEPGEDATAANRSSKPRAPSVSATHVGLRTTSPGETMVVTPPAVSSDPTDMPPRLGGCDEDTVSMSAAGIAAGIPPVDPPVQRWKVQCVHCEATLAIKPIERPSRMTCPTCQCKLVIQTDQRVGLLEASTVQRHHVPAQQTPAAASSDVPPSAVPTQSPAEVVSQLATMLHAPSGSDDTSTPHAAPSAETLPMRIQSPDGSTLCDAENSTYDSPPELDGSLDSLLSQSESQETVGSMGPIQIASPALGPEAVVLAILVCALPVFAGVGMTIFADNPSATAWIEAAGEPIRETLRTMRSWVGGG